MGKDITNEVADFHPIRFAALTIFLTLLFFGFQAFCARPFLRIPPRPLEPLYADAVLQFNAGDYEGAEKILKGILVSGEDMKTLELLALTYQNTGQDKKSLEIYNHILRRLKENGAAKSELAPSIFEIALSQFKARNFAAAQLRFQYCLNQKFNEGADHFLIGLIDLDGGRPDSSTFHFEKILATDAETLKPFADFYLASIAASRGDWDRSLQKLSEAERLLPPASDAGSGGAENSEFSNFTDGLKKNIAQTLDEVNHSKWYGNITLLGSYDSNVLSVPTIQSLNVSAQGNGSAKAIAKAALAYATSPVASTQYVTTYQGAINFNANPATNTGQFAVNDLSFYINKNPYSRFAWGGKIEATSIFEYEVDPVSNSGSFGPYLLMGSVGPYLKFGVGDSQFLGFEVLYEPRDNYQDPAFSPAQRTSGFDGAFRTFYSLDKASRWWNPEIDLTMRRHQTDGTEFRSNSAFLGLKDFMFHSDKFQAEGSIQLGFTNFPDRLGQSRQDETGIVDYNISRMLSKKITFVGDLQYQLNLSTVPDLYQFNRWIFTLGISFLN